MAAAAPLRASPLALTVLFMLAGGPIHPYEMQRRIKLWGKDQVVNVAQRATLYKTIDRLHAASRERATMFKAVSFGLIGFVNTAVDLGVFSLGYYVLLIVLIVFRLKRKVHTIVPEKAALDKL